MAEQTKPTLLEFVTQVYFLERPLSQPSQNTFLRSCNQFLDFLGGDRPVDQIAERDVSRWVASIEGAYQPRTVKGKRGDVLCALRYAWVHGLCEEPKTKRVRNVTVPRPTPRAWTLDQLGALVEAARQLPGYMLDSTPRSLYWESVISATYDTGLRRADILTLKASEIDPNGRVWVVMHKTGEAVCRQLRPSTIALIQQLAAKRERDDVFMVPGRIENDGHVKQLNYWWVRIREIAGLEDRGAFHKLRRTGATYAERDCPGAAKSYLGHMTPGMEQHYVDLRIAGENPPLPPSVPTLEDNPSMTPPVAAPTLAALLALYLEAKPYINGTYQKQLARAVKQFTSFLGGDRSIDKIEENEVRAWGAEMKSRLTENYATFSEYLLRQLFRFANETKLRPPLRMVPRGKRRQTAPKSK